jgi:hypothetical protein
VHKCEVQVRVTEVTLAFDIATKKSTAEFFKNISVIAVLVFVVLHRGN